MSEKLGLALSGGGFRASLFHIGVLARLAELDLLRKIDVISTVSGGSIVGAYYYLKLKELLEGRRGDSPQPSRTAYVEIVREIERDFLAAIQKNLRVRAFWNPYKTARMILSDDYSRSDRMAELYDEHLYLPLWRQLTANEDADRIRLRDIKIFPSGAAGQIDPKEYNQQAEFKVPILVINATTLNTGHAWHFTSSWIGEPDLTGRPPGTVLDTNVTFEQLRFDGRKRSEDHTPRTRLRDASREAARIRKLNEIKLSDAVAASACVPGIFAPMAIHDLYWNGDGKEIVVELVDGGVFDNQGLDALYMEDCSKIICSDASGQLEDERAPSAGLLGVVMRSNGVLMDRVRSDGFTILATGNHSPFAFFHLREDFPEQPGYPRFPGPVDRATPDDGHVYRLSNIRTDLDSFSDVEACSLMYDGYCLSNRKLFSARISTNGILPPTNGEGPCWRFLQVVPLLESKEPSARRRFLEHLRIGRENLFKVFRLLDPTAIALAAILLAFAGALAGWLWVHFPPPESITLSVKQVATALGGIVLVALLKASESTDTITTLLDKVRWLRRGHRLSPLFLALGAVCLLASAVVTLHLFVFDRLFLRSGRIQRIG